MLGIKSKSSPKTWRSSMNNSLIKGNNKTKKNVGNLINSEEELNLNYHYQFLQANQNLVKNIKKSLKLMILKNVNMQRLKYGKSQPSPCYI